MKKCSTKTLSGAQAVTILILAKKRFTLYQRKKTKKLINDLLAYNKLVEKNIFSSAENVYVDRLLSYKKDGVIHSFLDEYESKK